jgi:predicted enzyme related to lactoylglutathione lyase
VIGRISFVTIDANDPDALAAFWGRVLGTEISDVSDGGRFVFLAEAQGSIVAFQRVPEPKTGKNRVHLDVRVEDLGAATDAISSWAARGTAPNGPWTMRGGGPSTTRRAASSTST